MLSLSDAQAVPEPATLVMADTGSGNYFFAASP
jgi:hypothetical protein